MARWPLKRDKRDTRACPAQTNRTAQVDLLHQTLGTPPPSQPAVLVHCDSARGRYTGQEDVEVSPTQSRVSPSIQRILSEKASIGAIDFHWVNRPVEPLERGKRHTRVCLAQTRDTRVLPRSNKTHGAGVHPGAAGRAAPDGPADNGAARSPRADWGVEPHGPPRDRERVRVLVFPKT